MKSRRPPLNLTEPKLKSAEARLKAADGLSDDAATSDMDIAARIAGETLRARDILDAPLDAPDVRPETRLEAQPSYHYKPRLRPFFPEAPPVHETPPESQIIPPPEITPPVTTAPEEKPAETKRDLSTLKVKPEGIMKITGMSGALFWSLTLFVSLLWACGLTAFAFGAQSNLSAMLYAPFRIVVLAFLALFPAGLIFASAFALRNAAALSRQASRTAALADALLAPAAAAAHQTGDLVDTLRGQVDHAVRAVRLAHADISDLSAKLKLETERLQDAAQIARAATQSVTRSLEYEREALGALSDSLGTQANGIIEAVDRQARMVADASDLAQTQLREAEASLASSAGTMVTAAADVSDAARTASEDLDRQAVRLETAGAGVVDQIQTVEEGLAQQRAGLVSAALSLRADQDDFAVHIENQRAQLTEALSITRLATVDLGETSARGIDVLRDIVVSAQEHFRAVNGAAENERTAFETRIHGTLSNISVMAADARDDLVDETRRALEQLNVAATEARRAADQAAQAAQGRVDRLNETIFEASKKADEVFDARFSVARRLIEESSDLISEAGDQTAQKIDTSFANTRQTLAEMNSALIELSSGADQLPSVAQARIAEIRQSVEDGINAMMAAAQKAAQETEAVDTAFQERVKRNYDMLTEAVRLMGVIANDLPPPPVAVAPATTAPAPRAEAPAPQPAPQPVPARPAAPPLRLRLTPQTSPLNNGAETRPSPGPQQAPQPAPQPAPKPVAKPAPPPVSKPSPARANANTQDGWSWRELLNGMEGREPAPAPATSATPATGAQPPLDPEFDSLDDLMIAEVNAMGVDAASLLSRARIEETIGAIIAEDNEGARMVVRRVAPAAIRRLSRRLLSDAQLRQQANDFATFYDQQINMALMSKDVSKALNEVLSNDSGRAYLLLDAAISDLI
ncbi:hypothetical protein MMA231_01018 [Asticcacaulis sp. MM231]|uniref:tipN n=1 Tax=Asticcacaulis sp. MM231 TaxID=3157666 RepID=UPI0032D58640